MNTDERNVLTDGALENMACMVMMGPTEYREFVEKSLRLDLIIEQAKHARFFDRDDVLRLAGEEVQEDG